MMIGLGGVLALTATSTDPSYPGATAKATISGEMVAMPRARRGSRPFS